MHFAGPEKAAASKGAVMVVLHPDAADLAFAAADEPCGSSGSVGANAAGMAFAAAGEPRGSSGSVGANAAGMAFAAADERRRQERRHGRLAARSRGPRHHHIALRTLLFQAARAPWLFPAGPHRSGGRRASRSEHADILGIKTAGPEGPPRTRGAGSSADMVDL
jgi:hypothetical protein